MQRLFLLGFYALFLYHGNPFVVVSALLLSQVEISVLETLHQSTAGQQWLWSVNEELYGVRWNFSTDVSGQYLNDPCGEEGGRWQGIQCSPPCFNASLTPVSSCHVMDIVLEAYGLNGTLPSAITALHLLETLDLQDNPSLAGVIPTQVGNMTSLTSFQLQKALLTGTLPSSLGDLFHLEFLSLNTNLIQGTIPVELSRLTSLLALKLYSNKFTGAIPEELGELRQLESLQLYNNLLTNTLPPSLGLLTSLSLFILYDNMLNGTIPDAYGNLTSLQYFYLNANELSGSIPSSLSNLQELFYLWIHENHLTSTVPKELGQMTKLYYFAAHRNNLQGTLASDLGTLANLRYLYLYENSLSGTIPLEFAGMRSLYYMYLHQNELTGTVPSNLRLLNKLQQLRIHSNALTGSLPRLPISLDYVDLEGNHLTGSLPEELGGLPRLEVLLLNHNNFTGSLPVQISRLTRLQIFYLDSNSLEGTIPDEYGTLTALQYISFSNNKLHGSIPECIGNMTNLYYLDMSTNSFSSSLPPVFHKLQELRQIWLQYNHLTGTIPGEVFTLRKVEILWLQVNLFSGPIPQEVEELSASLNSFFISANLMTGIIPTELCECTTLSSLMLDNNKFSYSIPAEIGKLTNLYALYLHGNFLSGPIPSTLGQLHLLKSIEVSINYLTSTLPIELGSLVNLNDFLISDNLFIGSLDPIFWQTENMSLVFIDANNNQFSGHLSNRLFELPHIRSISLSVNCFTGKLPDTICSNGGVEFLALDGLGASSHCPNSVSVPFSQVQLFNTLEGTVPNCLFELENLTSLHMMGIGLTGSLSTEIPYNSSLQHLVLSHNKISGSVPTSLLQKSFEIFDLSYNKFSGTVDNFGVQSNESQLSLTVNRLSGNIPTSAALSDVNTLMILEGNMFGCHHNPSNDEYYREFNCGSSQLNDAMYVWEAILACLVLYFAVAMRATWCRCCFQEATIDRLDDITETNSLQKLSHLMRNSFYLISYPFALRVLSTGEFFAVDKVVLFCKSLYTTLKVGVLLSLMSIVVFIPFYGLKFADFGNKETNYATHSNTYGYILSMAYISGQAPAVLLLVGWALLVLMYAGMYMWIKIDSRKKENSAQQLALQEEKHAKDLQESSLNFDFVVLMATLSINSIIVGAVNALYLYSIYAKLDSQVRVGVQVIMSIFNFLFNLVCVPFLANSSKTPERNCHARLLMIILNNILIPCIVTACASPACFQGLFIEVDAIQPRYKLPKCKYYDVALETNTFSCVAVDIHTVLVSPVTPPFSYRYRCSSLLLSAYIPIYFYISAIELFFMFVLIGCLLLRKESIIRRLSKMGNMGILWPFFWSHWSSSADDNYTNIATPKLLLNTVKIATNDIVCYGAVQLTFGLTSPVLTIAVMISFCLKMSLWMMMLGRFLYHRINISVAGDDVSAEPRRSAIRETITCISDERNSQLNQDHALVALGETYLDISAIFVSCFWPIVCSSSCFIAALSWDMAADKAANTWSALWAPLIALGMPPVLWVVDVGLTRGRHFVASTSPQHRCSENNIEILGTSLNPLTKIE